MILSSIYLFKAIQVILSLIYFLSNPGDFAFNLFFIYSNPLFVLYSENTAMEV